MKMVWLEMEEMMEWVIETQGLSKTYKQVNALKELNLRVSKNSIFGFLGPNGAGKTTTIKLILNLIYPTKGSATIFGLDSVHDSVAIRSRIGYLPQDPRYYEFMTARQILDYTAYFFFKGPQAEIDARVSETLELVGLDDKADRPIKGFSGGERQRLGIAQAQVNYPDLLILDEPAASLDPMGRRDVLEVMARLRKHTTIFYCTHILDDVQRVSDTVAILNHGELVAHGTIEELLAMGEGLAYEVKLKGDADNMYNTVSSLPWITGVQQKSQNGTVHWVVNVSDPKAAEAELFRILASDDNLFILDFHLKEHELEEVFVRIVEGGENGNRK
jgi:ABC-2 type transport system ATP-binding protein